MTFRMMVCISIICVLNLGCHTWDKLDNKERGVVIGAGTGAVVGSSVGEGAGGALIGGAAGALGGGIIGHQIDRDEKNRRRY